MRHILSTNNIKEHTDIGQHRMKQTSTERENENERGSQIQNRVIAKHYFHIHTLYSWINTDK